MTVVFLTFHGLSHFNASFGVARTLSGSHDVIFAGFPSFRRHVEGQGFKYYSLQSLPFGLGFEEWVNEREGRQKVWLRSLRDRWTGRIFRERERELHLMIEKLMPAFILIDAQQPTDFFVLFPHAKNRGIKLLMLHTFLPQVLRKGYPPGNSLADPKDDFKVRVSTAKYLLQRKLFQARAFIKYLGRTNRSMIKSIMKERGVPLRYLSSSTSHLSVHIAGPQEIILCPKEFDFASAARSDKEHFVGFQPDTERREEVNISLNEYLNRFDLAKQPLIYCSFGTVAGGDRHRLNKFVSKLITSVDNKPYVLVISVMATGPIDRQITLPQNVYLMENAPQMVVLNRAAVFVTHGGFNSIKESIHAGVPMLVYPRDGRLDQRGNAARIRFNRLGLYGDLDRDNPGEILSKIDELLHNQEFRLNVKALRNVDLRYTRDAVVNLLLQAGPPG